MTSTVAAARAMQDGWSAIAASALAEAEFWNLRLARKTLEMCKTRYPDEQKLAEAYALYILGVYEHPPD